ncbi:hypothetical protein ACQEVZ_43730 [Dactylosporangium sp. CA-152071]|uniref:hypothetical protein n=1 Tax=Dactylosporangium sp. CA-152071 TaxID=3239933 RepID=UPI003D91D036
MAAASAVACRSLISRASRCAAGLIAGGLFVDPFVRRAGLERAAWISATSVVAGLAVFTLLHGAGYVFVAAALVLVAAGLRVAGVVAGVNVLRGLPPERTTIGVALTDTATEVTSGAGIAVTCTILAALFTGTITAPHWSAAQTAQFDGAVTVAGLTLTTAAAALVGWALLRTRRAATPSAPPRSAGASGQPAHASGPSRNG